MNRYGHRMSQYLGTICLAGAIAGMMAGCESPESAAAKKQAEASEAAAHAEEDFQKSMDRPPTTATLYAMSRILEAQGRDTECRGVLQKIIREHPEYMPAYNDLAELDMHDRKIDRAMETLSAGLKVSPNEAILVNNVGMCLLLKGEYEDAMGRFTLAAGLAPDDPRYRANIATALGMQGRYDEALALYEQITSEADAHYNIGVLADARKDHARAVTEFDLAKAIEADPKGMHMASTMPAMAPTTVPATHPMTTAPAAP